MGGRGFEAPKAPSRDADRRRQGGGNGEGVPLPSRLGRLGECRELPQRGPGRIRPEKRISVLSKRHRMPVVEMFVVNWGGGYSCWHMQYLVAFG